mmetsp:Transcript_138347/g.239048  ORF Transcript_138347/g.239048 Transcript_138347/m.239048 type:complete len:85 (+) Transcript_138347:3-257(+)
MSASPNTGMRMRLCSARPLFGVPHPTGRSPTRAAPNPQRVCAPQAARVLQGSNARVQLLDLLQHKVADVPSIKTALTDSWSRLP